MLVGDAAAGEVLFHRLRMLTVCLLVSAVVLQRFELQVQPGDIIVTGSDGLWDNIFAEEAATIASKCRDKGETATTAAQVLCR